MGGAQVTEVAQIGVSVGARLQMTTSQWLSPPENGMQFVPVRRIATIADCPT